MDDGVEPKNFPKMSLADLKEYLKARGVTVSSYLKPALVEIAMSVEKMMIPLDPSYGKPAEQGKLIIHGIEMDDPLSGIHKYVNDFIESPPFGLFDIFNHLIYSSTEYDKQGLAAYKAFDDYRLFEEGYVESLVTKPLPMIGVHLYMGKVRPSMKKSDDAEGKAFYELWFILEGRGASRGTVLKAFCTCKGGRDGGCKHISAAMYSLEDLLHTRCTDSVTSGPCQWVKRPTSSSKPCELKHLKIGKCSSPLKKRTPSAKPKEKLVQRKKRSAKSAKMPPLSVSHKKRKKTDHTFAENIDVDVRNEDNRSQPSPESLERFVTAISGEYVPEQPAIFRLLEKKYIPEEKQEKLKCGSKYSASEKGTEVSNYLNTAENIGIMKEKLLHYNDKEEVISLIGNEDETLITSEEINHINTLTMRQWKCQDWYIQKAGVISASKVKRVHNSQESLKRCANKDISKLVNEIVSPNVPTSISSLPDQPKNPRDWGLKHEATARMDYKRVTSKQHRKLKLESKGFMISKEKPFIGASVDNIRHCACEEGCPAVVVEYKCPWKHKDKMPKEAFLTPEVGGQQQNKHFTLKKNCQYYFQVQIQMFVYKLQLCDFVIWTRCGVFVVEVPFDELFVVPLVEKFQTFWLDHVLTVMLPQNGVPIQCKLVFFVHSYLAVLPAWRCIWLYCQFIGLFNRFSTDKM